MVAFTNDTDASQFSFHFTPLLYAKGSIDVYLPSCPSRFYFLFCFSPSPCPGWRKPIWLFHDEAGKVVKNKKSQKPICQFHSIIFVGGSDPLKEDMCFPIISSLSLSLSLAYEGWIRYFVFYTQLKSPLSLYLMFPPFSSMELERSHHHLLSGL